jgi:hypothetical protein
MIQSATLPRMMALVLLGMSTSGCEVVGGIFKAGVWVGAMAVVAVIVVIVFAIAKMRG